MKKALLLLSLLLIAFRAFSHPHVFIDLSIKIDELDKAEISWTFDPIESENKLYYFDDDGDGNLNSGEVANLYSEGFENLSEFNYFITLTSGKIKYPVTKVHNFNVRLEEDRRMTFIFDIDLPEIDRENMLAITHFDTSYFISFSDPLEKNISVPESLFTAILKNSSTPYYYDPAASRSRVLDTSKPQPGWLVAYPTELFLSSEPIINSFGEYKIGLREKLNQIQKAIYLKLSDLINNLKERRSPGILLTILLISFLYGVVHALGPGHRKIVISSYILAKPEITYLKSAAISFSSALIHSGSGIVSIIILKIVFDRIKPGIVDHVTERVEFISYTGVLILAVILIILKLIPRKKEPINNRAAGLSLIILSSLIPCPGALTIMLFSLSLNILVTGIVTVLAMSSGIGLTLTIISFITLKSKHVVNNRAGKRFNKIGKVIEWTGLLLLFIFSIFMIFTVYK